MNTVEAKTIRLPTAHETFSLRVNTVFNKVILSQIQSNIKWQSYLNPNKLAGNPLEVAETVKSSPAGLTNCFVAVTVVPFVPETSPAVPAPLPRFPMQAQGALRVMLLQEKIIKFVWDENHT